MIQARAKILVIDDEPSNLRLAVDLLEARGFATLTASDGERGIRRAAAAADDVGLILLDVQMPGIDGYETCRRLKANPITAAIPVIFMTAMSEPEDKLRAFGSGGVDYVTKPFEAEELRARIETHLELARLQQQLREHNATLEERVAARTRELSETHLAASRFVPDHVLASLGHHDLRSARLGDHRHGEYTVMFADIRGYTTLSEALSHSETFALLNVYCGRMGPVISANGGNITHFLGDGLLAIFPTADGAAEAAVGMHREMDIFNVERVAAGLASIRVGVGLNTGPLTLGIIGDGRRLDVTIIGDAVNVASRVEGLSKTYGVRTALSGSTRQALQQDRLLRFLDRVQVKGKTEHTEIYELLESDPEELRARKRHTLEAFSAGQEALGAGDPATALKILTDVHRELPDDPTVRLWLERAARQLLGGS